jgi:hypothetical protein
MPRVLQSSTIGRGPSWQWRGGGGDGRDDGGAAGGFEARRVRAPSARPGLYFQPGPLIAMPLIATQRP